MSKKCSLWTMNQPLSSIDTDLNTIKLTSMKDDKQNQSKNPEKIEKSLSMSSNADVLPLATTTALSSSIDEQSTLLSGEKLLNDILLTSKRNHKHKHHHHRHHCRHHHHHHHNHRHRVKNTNKQPAMVYREVSSTKNQPVNTKTLTNVPSGINNQSTSMDDQEAPSIINTSDQVIKPSKGNIPLQPIENKLVSQRVAPTDEAQVGNFSSIIYTQPSSSICNTDCIQPIEQIFYENDCCLPSSTINCASNSCVLQQSEPIICCCQQQQQQQQQQLFYCTDPISTQDFICSSSGTIQPTIIQQVSACNTSSNNLSSQPVICISQPTAQQVQFIQAPQTQPAQYLQISSATPQIIQTPQIQSAQYLQISSATPQIIQTIQAPGVQNLQSQFFQTIQVPTQAVMASPQILYQRPYDPMVIPVQNQQLAIAQTPLVALSQPSYAPARVISATPARKTTPGPHMFQHALVRTVANRTGVPVLSPNVGGLQLVQPPMVNPSRGAALASTGRTLLNGGAQPSTSLPIVPLTTGGLLIPFKPSEPPKGMIQGTLPRKIGYPAAPINYDLIRQQIQKRAQFLADLQQQNPGRIPSLPVRSTNTVVPTPPPPLPSTRFSRTAPISTSRFSSNIPMSSSSFSSNIPLSSPITSSNLPQSSSLISPNIPQPPPLITSQTPYTSGNTRAAVSSSSSSSNSSKSSNSSILPASTTQTAPSNLIYSTPSFTDARAGSNVSRPSASYQSLRP